MAILDTGYQHWEGTHRGVWHRRAVISLLGLKTSLSSRWTKYLVFAAWGSALAQVGLLFCIGQLLIADSAIVGFLPNLDPVLRTFLRGMTVWLEQHPEISVRISQNLLFYSFNSIYLPLSLITLTIAIPHLISKDLSTHAILVYSSRAVGRLDYLCGKFGVVMGLLILTWIGPVFVAWLLGNLLAPDWHFFWHSRWALGHALLFAVSASLFLGLLALGTSAVSSNNKLTVALWLALWLIGNAFVGLGEHTKPWLKHLSFRYDLQRTAATLFQPKLDLELAKQKVPVLRDILERATRGRPDGWDLGGVSGALVSLAVFAGASVTILCFRMRNE